MDVFIKIEQRGRPVRYHSVEKEEIHIGRRPGDNDLVLGHRSVSRKHALLVRTQGRFVLADKVSSAGTFLNGRRVTGPVVVRPGERIAIGESVLTLVLGAPADQSEISSASDTSEGSGEAPLLTRPGAGRDEIAFGDAGEALTLHHAEGGVEHARLRRELIEPAFANLLPAKIPEGPLASRVLWCAADPRVFPGGDLGSLVVATATGAMCERGARLVRLRLDMLAEPSFSMQELRRHLRSLRAAAFDDGIEISVAHIDVTASHHGLLFRTVAEGVPMLSPAETKVAPADVVLATGTLGAHGAALEAMAAEARVSRDVFSDAGSTSGFLTALKAANVTPRRILFPYSGGVGQALEDLARRNAAKVLVHEADVRVDPAVEALALSLDLDPLFAACAGVLLVVVSRDDVDRAVEALRKAGADPAPLAEVLSVGEEYGTVLLGTKARHRPLGPARSPMVGFA